MDASGNVYVTGCSHNGIDIDYVTVKYDASGNEEWVNRYDGLGDSTDLAYAMAVDTSGYVYVTGGSGATGAGEFATVKYDSSGNEKWVERYGGPGNSDDYARSIAVDSAGIVYVTGESYGDPDHSTVTVKYPQENCTNGIDDDGDGDIDCWDSDCDPPTVYYADVDGDAYGNPDDSDQGCTRPPGYVTDDTDCDDTEFYINPGGTEECDGRDNNCDGAVDEGLDADGDGIADCFDACPHDADNDTDGDNVCGDVDNCPVLANANQADNDGDGAGDLCDDDDDNDGISDRDETTCGSDTLNAHSVCEVCDGADNDLNDGVDEGFPNTDGDAMADCVDPDDDNDGQSDDDETTCGSDPKNASNMSSDNDGDSDPDCVDTDDDNDGVVDGNDNCRLVTNADQTDTDNDKQGDACDADDDNDTRLDGADNCPLTANTDQSDNEADGLGDVCDDDDDNDTILDTADNCPFISNTDQEDSDADGLGNVCDTCPNDFENDADDDGICGDLDNCPDNPNPGQADADNDGIGDVCEGDLNSDGILDSKDLDILLSEFNNPAGSCPVCDLNNDGVITMLDIRALLKINPLLSRDLRIRLLLRSSRTRPRG